MTRPTRQQYADLDFGEGDREPARVVGLPLPDHRDDATSKRYVDGSNDDQRIEIARLKTAFLVLFDFNVDELDPLPDFLTEQ